MGLFSDLFGSSSHSQQTTSTSKVTNTQLAGGNIGGPAVYGSGNYIVSTDAGALRAATDISEAALALGHSEAATGAAVAIAGLNHASDAYTSSLALVGDVNRDSLNNDFALAGKAIDSVSRFSTSALDANTYIAGKSIDALSQSFTDSLATTGAAQGKALVAVEDIAAQVSQSAQQTSDKTVKSIVLYGALAVVAIFAFKSGRF